MEKARNVGQAAAQAAGEAAAAAGASPEMIQEAAQAAGEAAAVAVMRRPATKSKRATRRVAFNAAAEAKIAEQLKTLNRDLAANSRRLRALSRSGKYKGRLSKKKLSLRNRLYSLARESKKPKSKKTRKQRTSPNIQMAAAAAAEAPFPPRTPPH
jgi:hypothetical protein